MRKIRMAIIGAGREGSSLYYCFRIKPQVSVVGIADVTGQGLGVNDAIQDGVLVSTSLEDIMTIEGLDVIVETTKDPVIADKVHRLKHPDTQVVEANSLELMVALGDRKERTEAEMLSILGSVNDAVQIVDKDGVITFVNKAFEKAAGISAQELMGQSVFDKFSNSPVASVLSSGEPLTNQKYALGSSARDYNCNVTPILVKDEVVGAIGVFKMTPDVIKLMEELQRSTSIIEGLYDRLGQINGLAEIDVSDVMPIDKMEQILLRQALMRFGYSVEGKKKAAKALNISLATLYNKLKKYQIN